MRLPKFQKPTGWKASLKTRSFRVGGYSVAAAAMVLAIAIAANAFVGALPATLTQIDLTSAQLFSLSEETETMLDGLEEEITIYWVVQSGYEDTDLETLLGRYTSLADSITLEKIDPDVYPTFAQQYTSGGIYNNSLAVVCGDRSRWVSNDEIYLYDYSNYYYDGTYEVSFAGESSITSAISYVTAEDLPRVYTLTGHGESELPSSFQSAIAGQNMTLNPLSLLTVESAPADAGCIIIHAPQSDLSSQEVTILRDYLQTGGSLFLLTDPLSDGQRLPNLEGLMAEYGVTAQTGIVLEGDQNHQLSQGPYYLLPNLGYHTITEPLSEEGYYVLLPVAQGLTVSEELPEGVTVTSLLTTSSAAFSKVSGYAMDTYEKEKGDLEGPFDLAVAITEEIDEETSAQIVWVSSSSLADEDADSWVSGGNLDFFLNALGWMCDHEESITIHAKSLNYESLTMSGGTSAILSLLVVGVLPLTYLIVGIRIWIRRKRR
ncbi:MAG: GldG family protein [Ruminiclostridium sp.]|nr:GldG family protein [Ruminiclostridium sp.]